MSATEEVERLCEVMHDAYEKAAVGAGWETQQASRKPWSEVPEANKSTMRVAVVALLQALPGLALAAGFVVVRDEDGEMVCDWDGEIHPDREHAEVELLTARRREPLYQWYLAEVRPARAGAES